MARDKTKGKKKGGPKKLAGGKKPQSKFNKEKGKGKGKGAENPSGGDVENKANPFDTFQNKRRHRKVLGEKIRGSRRDLTKSRGAAAEERAKGLLKDKYEEGRSSKFVDKRIGSKVVEDEDGIDRTAMQRLVKLRQKEAKKSFNLGAGKEEMLTVGGKSLADMADQDLNQDVSGDEDDGDPVDPDDPVAKSKAQKAEFKKEQAHHESQLKDLDADFGDLLGELSFRPPKALAPIEKRTSDDYDKVMKDLAWDRRVGATDRTKTAEEIARDKREMLEALERERVMREDGIEVAAEDGNGPAGAEDGSEDASSGGEVTDDEGEEEEEEVVDDEEVAEDEDEVEANGDEGDDADDVALKKAAPNNEALPLLLVEKAAALDIMKNGKGEEGLPFAVECPGGPKAVRELLVNKSVSTVVKLVQRIRTCTAATLDVKNKAKLKAFFLALLEYLLDALARPDGDISVRGLQALYALRSVLVEMAGEHPEDVRMFFSERLHAMSPASMPRAAQLGCLKVIALLFPVSDFQHAVVSPAAALAEHWAGCLARLGAGLMDLVGDALVLWEVLYQFTIPAGKFSASFFQLGMALLATCRESTRAGRKECAEAANDIVKLLISALQALSEVEDRSAATMIGETLLRPELEANPGDEMLQRLADEIKRLAESAPLAPLTLFEAPRPQIRTLDPIFHLPGDILHRGQDKTETQLLKNKVSQERLSAKRQLRRDAEVLQSLESQKETNIRVQRVEERHRVRGIMDAENHMLRKSATENTHAMDTSLHSFSRTKERKKENKRMGGNATEENKPKGPAKGDADAGPGRGNKKKGSSKKKARKKGP